MDDLDIEIHFYKESVVLSKDSRSSDKFMHGIKVFMCSNSTQKDQTLKATVREAFDIRAVANTAWQREKVAGISGDLYPEMAPHTGHSSQLALLPTSEKLD